MECIHLNFLTDNKGKKFLSPSLPNSDLNGKILKVIISDGSTKRVYPVFQQKGRHDPRQVQKRIPDGQEKALTARTPDGCSAGGIFLPRNANTSCGKKVCRRGLTK